MSKKYRSVFTLIVGIVTAGFIQSANADWTDNVGSLSPLIPQDVVVSLKSNPMSNPEAACLAVTFARSLAMGAGGIHNITLFVTLDGVSLGDEGVVSSRRFTCETPFDGEEEGISLKEHLELFLDGDKNNMVVCPICWNKRYDEAPFYGFLPPKGSTAIGKMIFSAEKILDF